MLGIFMVGIGHQRRSRASVPVSAATVLPPMNNRLTTSDDSPADVWQVPAWYHRAASWTWRALVLAAGMYAAARVFGALRIVLVPVLIAALLTAATEPIVRRLCALGVNRTIAALLVFLVSIGVVVAGSAYVGMMIGSELQQAEWNVVRQDVESWLMNGPADLSAAEVDDLEARLSEAVVGGVGEVSLGRVQLISSLTGAALLTVVLYFFFLKDINQVWRWCMDRIRPRRRDTLDQAGRAAADALAGYMRAIFVAGIVDGVSIGIAMAVVGAPLAIPVAVVTGFAAFLPIVGAILAGGVAVLVTLVFNGPGDALIVGIVALAVQQIEGNVVVPLVMGRQVSLHPALVLIALGIGGATAGIVGAFIAVPFTATSVAALSALRQPGHQVETVDLSSA